jgi:hypothetical protein
MNMTSSVALQGQSMWSMALPVSLSDDPFTLEWVNGKAILRS